MKADLFVADLRIIDHLAQADHEEEKGEVWIQQIPHQSMQWCRKGIGYTMLGVVGSSRRTQDIDF